MTVSTFLQFAIFVCVFSTIPIVLIHDMKSIRDRRWDSPYTDITATAFPVDPTSLRPLSIVETWKSRAELGTSWSSIQLSVLAFRVCKEAFASIVHDARSQTGGLLARQPVTGLVAIGAFMLWALLVGAAKTCKHKSDFIRVSFVSLVAFGTTSIGVLAWLDFSLGDSIEIPDSQVSRFEQSITELSCHTDGTSSSTSLCASPIVWDDPFLISDIQELSYAITASSGRPGRDLAVTVIVAWSLAMMFLFLWAAAVVVVPEVGSEPDAVPEVVHVSLDATAHATL